MADQAASAPSSAAEPIGFAADKAAEEDQRSVDVWSRWGSRYRTRAVILLAVNVVLFVGVCSFAFWLRSGEYFAPRMDSYWGDLAESFDFHGERSVNLQTFLLEPISVQDVPVQIPILGLLLAALISIPILVAILYRFWSALPFVVAVGFIAMMPWLAIALLISAVIASVPPFRSSIRFMSALLALIPATIYLILASSGSDVAEGILDPIDRMKFVAPWVLAIIASSVLFAVVLTLAKVVNFRPGVITPLLAMMFGLPVALFEVHVGRDELHYRLISALDRYAFEDMDTSLDLQALVEQRWLRHPRPKPSLAHIRASVEMRWLIFGMGNLGPDRTVLEEYRARLVTKWDWFLEHFPDSRYALNALYLKARAMDMRVDLREFKQSEWIRYYDDFPSEHSKPVWQTIVTNQAPLHLTAVAKLRLAQINARDETRVELAVRQLEEAIALLALRDRYLRLQRTQHEQERGVLDPQDPITDLNIPVERVRLETHRLHDLLAENNDPLYGYDPICGSLFEPQKAVGGLLDMDPRELGYGDKLTSLRQAYPRCQLEDNVVLEIAKATDEADAARARASSVLALRIARLQELIAAFPEGDAVPEALFRLGVAHKQNQQPARSQECLEQLIRDYPDSIWSRQAQAYSGLPLSTSFTEAKG
jgi:hypothetical protein